MAPRISYVPVESMDERMQEEMHRCAREGTPRPESSAVRAHAPQAFWGFVEYWNATFHGPELDHAIKELCRVYVSRTVKCEFCGNQRSEKATTAGLLEQQFDELLNFESSDRYDERQKAALAYTEAIAWRLDTDDAFWERMHAHFSEPELTELGCFVALTFGAQSWLRMLDLEHHQVLAGTAASMAPGFETAEALARSKADGTYWAKGEQPAGTGT